MSRISLRLLHTALHALDDIDIVSDEISYETETFNFISKIDSLKTVDTLVSRDIV